MVDMRDVCIERTVSVPSIFQVHVNEEYPFRLFDRMRNQSDSDSDAQASGAKHVRRGRSRFSGTSVAEYQCLSHIWPGGLFPGAVIVTGVQTDWTQPEDYWMKRG
jgi:hypothetical protein